MKARLLAGTGLAGMMALAGGAHAGGVAPIWHLTGNANFQAYWIDQDAVGLTSGGISPAFFYWSPTTLPSEVNVGAPQEHDWYFGVDEAELQLNVSGTADNGLNYGFKIEINANTTDEAVADEVRLALYGRWGTLQFGDEDGADNVMNYGGETLLGGAGGFDGDHNDYLFRGGWAVEGFVSSSNAPAFPLLAGDSGDATKISYYSPRIGGFQVGASYTPTFSSGDAFKADTIIEDHYGIGLNFDRSFGDFRARASAVYAAAEVDFAYSFGTELEDIAVWSAGAILGWGPFSIGGGYGDNGDSGRPTNWDIDSGYWNVAAALEFGRFYLSAGYFESEFEWTPEDPPSKYTHTTLAADYSLAPGLALYGEVDWIEDKLYGDYAENNATAVILGANVSF